MGPDEIVRGPRENRRSGTKARRFGHSSENQELSEARCELNAYRALLPKVALLISIASPVWLYSQKDSSSSTMSFSNRQLFNRAAVDKETAIEVMLIAEVGKLDELKRAVASAGGVILREDVPTGYLRIQIASERLSALVEAPLIAAFQIASNANMIWDQEGQSEDIAKMYRRYESRALGGDPMTQKEEQKDLPTLTVPESLAYGYTGEEETGVGEWLSQHPSWDGRGVTIALLESALPEFTHPTMKSAKALDGTPIPKIAGIINTVDLSGQDYTRIDMKTTIHSDTTWYTVKGRTYILPRSGTFHFGIFSAPSGGSVHEDFAVLWDQATGEIWIDTDGDASFEKETVMHDVNEHFDVGYLNLTYPEKKKIEFVVAKGRAPDTLHLYPSRGGHQAMTASVAAGSRTEDGVASGVAPNARVMFVRNQAGKNRASDFVEGYIEIASRPDVDVMTDSRGLSPVPDIGSEFYSLMFDRIASTYHKPIFHSGGNNLPALGQASGLEGVFSVGGSMSPSTYSALFGAGTLDRVIKHPLSAEGPGGGGTLKPDFIAPMHRISADVCVGAYSYGAPVSKIALPKNSPKVVLPPCYQISCCTSASGPYAAGVAALLESAARQEGETVSLESMGRALRSSAQFLPDTPAFAQGAGILNVEAAWKEMQSKINIPLIKITGPLVYPMAKYARHPSEGGGLLELSGWTPGQTGQRSLHLERESGPAAPSPYKISWTGNDGTFKSATSITLPLNESVALPVKIAVSSYGPHSAILNIHDPETGAIVVRTLATVVVPQPIPSTAGNFLKLQGAVSLMRSNDYYLSVPDGTQALKVDVDITQGALSPMLRSLDPSQMVPNRPTNMFKTLKTGKYTFVVPRPSSGTWSLTLTNDSGWRAQDSKEVSTEEAKYAVIVSALRGDLEMKKEEADKVSFHLKNTGANLIEPVVDVYPGTLTSRKAPFNPTGEPNLIEVNAPKDAGILEFDARAELGASDLELFLYDCTSGACFFSDYAGIAASKATIAVHNPKPGKWILAVNAAPSIVGHGQFVVDEFVGAKATRQIVGSATKNSVPNEWHTAMSQPPLPAADAEGARAFLCELVDAALERAQLERQSAIPPPPGESKTPPVTNPIAVATKVFPAL